MIARSVKSEAKQRSLADDVEEGFLLAGEARLRQVLGRGGAAHRDGDPLVGDLDAEVAVSAGDGLGDRRRELGALDEPTDRLAGPGQRDLAGRELGQGVLDRLPELVGGQEVPVRLGGRGEAGRDLDANRAQRAYQLAERGVLAADARHVGRRQVAQADDVVAVRR
jgi:hypothetical protein